MKQIKTKDRKRKTVRSHLVGMISPRRKRVIEQFRIKVIREAN